MYPPNALHMMSHFSLLPKLNADLEIPLLVHCLELSLFYIQLLLN